MLARRAHLSAQGTTVYRAAHTTETGGVFALDVAADAGVLSLYADLTPAQEQELAAWFRQQGRTVQEPDRAAFRAACVPLHNQDVGWTKAQYDRLQAL